MPKRWFLISLLNLLIAMSIGALLRYAFVDEISWLKFTNFLHAHSHVAMLGWVYLALFTFLIVSFLSKKQIHLKYVILFWLTQISVWGMLITFSQNGYYSWSIGFSVVHTLLSYAFVFYFLKDLKNANSLEAENKNTFSNRFVKMGLFFMIFSTLGLWAMGPLVANDLQGGAFYYSTIQFYLHFQFNGWFIFSIIGFFYKILENHNIHIPQKLSIRFFYFLVVSCFLTYALAVTWSKPLPILFTVNSLGVMIQLLALYFFIKIIQAVWKKIRGTLNATTLLLFRLAFLSFVLKIIVQSAVVIPTIAIIGYTIRNYVIGFLHLMLIGMVTLFLLGYAQKIKFIRLDSSMTRIGLYVLIAGFLLSEFILILQGSMFWAAMGFMPYYDELLFGVSALIPLGLLVFLLGQYRKLT